MTLERYLTALLNRRWLSLFLLLGALGLAAWPLTTLRIEGNYEVFFDPDDPRLRTYHALEEQFSSSDAVTFMVVARSGDVFTPTVAKTIRAISEAAWSLPHVERVDSLANAALIDSSADGIEIDEVFPPGLELTSELLADRRARVLADELLLDSLVSRDGHVAAVHATVNPPGLASDEPAQIVAAARAIRDAHASDVLDIRLTGLVAINNGFAEGALNDMLWLGPAMFAVMLVVAWLTLRSIAAVGAVVAAMVGAQWIGLGLASAAGIPLTPPSASGTSIIATLAVANAVHVVAAMQHGLAAGLERTRALQAALAENFTPIVLTTLTTIVGFLALNSSSVPPYRYLGNTAALGIAASFVLTYTLLPILLDLWGAGARRAASTAPTRFATFVVRERRWLSPTAGALSLGLAALAFTNKVDDDFVTYFATDHPVRTNAEFAMEHLGGVYTLHYRVDAGAPDGAVSANELARLRDFTAWAEAQPLVNKVVTLAPVIERIGSALGADPPLPASDAAAAQYLLLYEMSLPPGQGVRDKLSADRSASRMIIVIGQATNAEILSFANEADDWLREHWQTAAPPQPTGPVLMFMHLFREATFSTLRGLGAGALLIAIIIGWTLRSARLGALSLVPNAIPAMMALGAWALLDGRLNVAASSVAALSFGIIVDDTIHILTRYRRQRRLGQDATAAMSEALTRVARPITSTTLILTAGFSLLAFSDFGINVTLGLLTALTISLALALDFLVLPGIVIALDRRRRSSRP